MTRRSPAQITSALSVGLMLGQLAIMAVPALSVDLAALWQLNASEIGWLGGIYFAGYAVALPFITGAAKMSAIVIAIAFNAIALNSTARGTKNGMSDERMG